MARAPSLDAAAGAALLERSWDVRAEYAITRACRKRPSRDRSRSAASDERAARSWTMSRTKPILMRRRLPREWATGQRGGPCPRARPWSVLTGGTPGRAGAVAFRREGAAQPVPSKGRPPPGLASDPPAGGTRPGPGSRPGRRRQGGAEDPPQAGAAARQSAN
eukprot:15476888-Alexandrium_andersonii.AAC.1